MGLGCDALLGNTVVIWQNITLYSLIIVLPPCTFLLFLLYKLKASLQILSESTADVRTFRASALAFLWIICIVNIGRMIIQVLVPYDNEEWRVLWVATRFGDTLLQIFIIIFVGLFLVRDIALEKVVGMGRMDNTVKRILLEALIIATLLAIIETTMQALFVFLLDLPIYDTDGGQYSLFWIVRHSIYAIVYFILLCSNYFSSVNAEYTSNLLSLNDKPSLFGVSAFVTIYMILMLVLTFLNLIAWILLYFELNAGICFVGLELFIYYSCYPPVVYLIFMAKFFETAEHWPLKHKKIQKQQRKARQAQREADRQRRERDALLKAVTDDSSGEGKDSGNSWPLMGPSINSSSPPLYSGSLPSYDASSFGFSKNNRK